MRPVTVWEPGDILYTHGGERDGRTMPDIRCWQIQPDGSFLDITSRSTTPELDPGTDPEAALA